MDYQLMIDRCSKCGAPIYWDDQQNKRIATCPCGAKNADGCCPGGCGCDGGTCEVPEEETIH